MLHLLLASATLIDIDARTTESENYASERLELQAGRIYVVETTNLSRDADTLVSIRSPAAAEPSGGDPVLIWADDRAPDDLSSRARFVVPETGEYYVMVERYLWDDGRSTHGTFHLSLVDAGPVPVLDGLIHGLFVGIEDYEPRGDEGDDIGGCAADAMRIYLGLAELGALAPDSTLLVNEAATLDAVDAAVSRLSGAAGEDGVFLFFYSGHGRREGQGYADEPTDGRDELLALYDGDLRDDRMVTLLADFRATAILAFDSCFSGGFAEAVDAPRRVGLFASEEDVVSLTAPTRGAGGYLALFLAEGLEGGADMDADGKMDLGELLDYLDGRWRDNPDELDTERENGRRVRQVPVTRVTEIDRSLILGPR